MVSCALLTSGRYVALAQLTRLAIALILAVVVKKTLNVKVESMHKHALA